MSAPPVTAVRPSLFARQGDGTLLAYNLASSFDNFSFNTILGRRGLKVAGRYKPQAPCLLSQRPSYPGVYESHQLLTRL